MVRNHILTALRFLARHRLYSGINILGLAVGLTVVLLIGLFISNQLSFDQYHEGGDRLYRLTAPASDEDFDGIAKVLGPWGPTVAREIPAVEASTRFVFFGTEIFEVDGERRQVPGGFYADSTVFDVFSWTLRAGDEATALLAPNSLVLTETLAKTLFPRTEAMGQVVRIAGGVDYTVTAVMEDVPDNTHFSFQFLASMSSYAHEGHDGPRWNQYYTYLRLRPGADPVATTAAIASVLADLATPEQAAEWDPLYLQPVADIYLRSNMFREIAPMGDFETVLLLGLVALVILLLAGLNFVNLSSARATLRAKEVGVRKSLGANRSQVVRQFMVESLLAISLAGLLALLASMFLLPAFNGLAGSSFQSADLLSPTVLGRLLIGLLVLTVLAGGYPALVISAFRPTRAMRGMSLRVGGLSLRRGLVLVQAVISLALLMSTGIVRDQLDYLGSQSLGFEPEGVLAVFLQDPQLNGRIDEITQRIAQVPGVLSVAPSANRPGGGDWGLPVVFRGIPEEEEPDTRVLAVGEGFTETYGLRILQGRDLESRSGAEDGVLVNQELVSQAGWSDPIGQIIEIPFAERVLEVVGVVEDFHFRSARETIAPLMLFVPPPDWLTMINIRVSTPRTADALAEVDEIYTQFDALNPLSYSFVDDQYAAMYDADQRLGRLLGIATALALFVALLGLFGMAAHAAERRTREIGVRKVIGASESQIVGLLSRETAALLGIASVLAAPLAFLAGSRWLENFAYHTDIETITLVGAALLGIGAALATTVVQSWRAAHLDPARTLRTE